MSFYLDAWRVTSRELVAFYRFVGSPAWFPIHVGLS